MTSKPLSHSTSMSGVNLDRIDPAVVSHAVALDSSVHRRYWRWD
ncbi:hypothetical protein [Streptomyces sviceus]